MNRGPYIRTFCGTRFYFEIPETHRFQRADIACALSKLCRFTGHVPRFYSVAQHAVMVSYMVPEADALAGLLHDASEAYLADISKPLKSLLPDYQRIEDRVQAAIARQFGFPFPHPESVRRADVAALYVEQRDIIGLYRRDKVGKMGERIIHECQTPSAACARFLERWYELQPPRRRRGKATT